MPYLPLPLTRCVDRCLGLFHVLVRPHCLFSLCFASGARDFGAGFEKTKTKQKNKKTLRHMYMYIIKHQVVAVDIAGAFDRVSHAGVIIKAQEAGIGVNLLAWLRDYLNGR